MENLTLESIQQKIGSLATRVFQEAGMELIELKVTRHRNNKNHTTNEAIGPFNVRIQITADKSSGGINIRECAILNRTLVAAIVQENLIPPEIFSLELSSPGLDRPLVTRKDFMRCIGQELHFWLNGPMGIGGKKEAQGVLLEVGESALTVNAPKQARLVLPLDSIIKGTLVI